MNTRLNKLLRKLDILVCVKRNQRANDNFSFFIKKKWELSKVNYTTILMVDISPQNLKTLLNIINLHQMVRYLNKHRIQMLHKQLQI